MVKTARAHVSRGLRGFYSLDAGFSLSVKWGGKPERTDRSENADGDEDEARRLGHECCILETLNHRPDLDTADEQLEARNPNC